MDPSKPASKPSVGSASGNLPTVSRTNAQPSKSFEATLAERTKPNVTSSKKPSAVDSVLTAIAQATDPDADLEAGIKIVEEQLAILGSRSILQAPKPSKMSVQREKSEAEEEGPG